VVVVSEEVHHLWLWQASLCHRTPVQAANENVKKGKEKKEEKCKRK